MAMTPISTLLLVMSSAAVLGKEWGSSSNGNISSNAFPGDDRNHNSHKSSGYEALVGNGHPVQHYELHDVVYNLSQALREISPENVVVAEKNVQNKSPFDTTTTLSMETTHSTSSEWSEMNSVEIHAGVKITVSAGIPFFGEVSSEWGVGMSSTNSYSYGESYTTSETTGHEISVDLPAYSNVKVSMIAKEANVDVPYTATLKIFFTDDTYENKSVAGVYKNVHYTSLDSVIESVPLNDTTVSGAIITSPLLSKTFMLTFHLGFFRLM